MHLTLDLTLTEPGVADNMLHISSPFFEAAGSLLLCSESDDLLRSNQQISLKWLPVHAATLYWTAGQRTRPRRGTHVHLSQQTTLCVVGQRQNESWISSKEVRQVTVFVYLCIIL